MKRKMILLAAAVLLASIVGGGTLAYTAVEGRAVNVITSGGVDIALHEEGDGGRPFPPGGIRGALPGERYTKRVRVENCGEHPAWVALRVETAVKLADGSRGDSGCVSLDWNEQDWSLGRDGLYYYEKPLAPGGFTRPLFTEVRFDPAMGNGYQGSRVTVQVQAMATQSENNGRTVWEAGGWPGLGQ